MPRQRKFLKSISKHIDALPIQLQIKVLRANSLNLLIEDQSFGTEIAQLATTEKSLIDSADTANKSQFWYKYRTNKLKALGKSNCCSPKMNNIKQQPMTSSQAAFDNNAWKTSYR